jgi:hypothetical protein
MLLRLVPMGVLPPARLLVTTDLGAVGTTEPTWTPVRPEVLPPAQTGRYRLC